MRVKLRVRTKRVGSRVTKTVEIPDDQWWKLDEEGRLELVEDLAAKTIPTMISWDWQTVGD